MSKVSIILLTCVIALGFSPFTSAANVNSSEGVVILKDTREPLDSNGSYHYDIQLSDGTVFKQWGQSHTHAHNDDKNGTEEEDEGLVIKGEYEFKDPQGTIHKVSYIADKNGFQPNGTGIFSRNSKKDDDKKESPLETISSSIFSSPSRDT